jgi:hypothetical protein
VTSTKQQHKTAAAATATATATAAAAAAAAAASKHERVASTQQHRPSYAQKPTAALLRL